MSPALREKESSESFQLSLPGEKGFIGNNTCLYNERWRETCGQDTHLSRTPPEGRNLVLQPLRTRYSELAHTILTRSTRVARKKRRAGRRRRRPDLPPCSFALDSQTQGLKAYIKMARSQASMRGLTRILRAGKRQRVRIRRQRLQRQPVRIPQQRSCPGGALGRQQGQ